jgi:hypothetical protein
MRRNLVTLLIVSLAMLAGACSDQTTFGPSQVSSRDDQQPSFATGVADDPKPRQGPGGSAKGWKK